MRFFVLGAVTVRVDGVPVPIAAPKQRVLLSVLLSRAGGPVSDDVLIDALWGDNAPVTARDTLRWHAHHLRRVLGEPGRLTRLAGGYALRVEDGELDADVFERRYRAGLGAREAGDETRAAELFAAALELWRGEAYGDVAVVPALRAAAAGLEELRLVALEGRNAAELALGRHHEVATRMSGLVAGFPLRESLWTQLLLATYRSGRPTDALAAFASARARFREELGADPSPELRELHRRILRHDPSLMDNLPTMTRWVPRELPPPPRGFIGRARLVASLGELLDEAGSVVLSGVPGVGKSALATHWGHLNAERFPHGQLYADLSGLSTEAYSRILPEFLTAIGLPRAQQPTEPTGLIAAYRSLTAGRRVLVVLDNAADAAQVRPLIPAGRFSRTLITSRDRLTGLSVREGARRIDVPPMDPAESLEILRTRLGAARADAEATAVRTVAGLCGHLPLALRIAAAVLEDQPHRTVESYAASLRVDARGASRDASGTPVDLGQPDLGVLLRAYPRERMRTKNDGWARLASGEATYLA